MQRPSLHELHAPQQPIPLQDPTLYSSHLHSGLQSLNANGAVFQQRQQQYALGEPPQAPRALHFEQRGLPALSAQFPAYPVDFSHAVTSPFALTSASLHPGVVQHLHAPRPSPRPTHPVSSPVYTTLRQPQFVRQPPQSHNGTQNRERGASLAKHGQFEGLRLIVNPPDLEEWRNKLFSVDDTITLTEDEYDDVFNSIF